MIANEYSSLGHTAYEIPLHLFDHDVFDTSGAGERIEFFGARHATLPALPGLRFETPPPIIFIIIDAARPDRTGLHGYTTRRTTPFLEEFAADAFVFDNARSAATATTCSMRCIFSGHYCSRALNEPALAHPFCTGVLMDGGYERFFVNHFHADAMASRRGVSTKGSPPTMRRGSN